MEIILTFVIIGILIGTIIYYVVYPLFNPKSKHSIKKAARLLIPRIEDAKKELSTILQPNYRATLIDTDEFKSRHQDLFIEVNELVSQAPEFLPLEVPEMDILNDFQNLILFHGLHLFHINCYL